VDVDADMPWDQDPAHRRETYTDKKTGFWYPSERDLSKFEDKPQSYLRVDMLQAHSFFTMSLLEYLRLVFWLLRATAQADDEWAGLRSVYIGFSKWYRSKSDYYTEPEWLPPPANAHVFATTANLHTKHFDNSHKLIQGILDSPGDAKVTADNPGLPAKQSRLRALPVLAGEIIRSAQVMRLVLSELEGTDIKPQSEWFSRIMDCVKFMEFNRKFALETTDEDTVQVRTDASSAWRSMLHLFFVRMGLAQSTTDIMQYNALLEVKTQQLVELEQVKNLPRNKGVKQYYCSQNYLLLWSRRVLLRYAPETDEYQNLKTYMQVFNQAVMRSERGTARNIKATKRDLATLEYKQLSHWKDMKYNDKYWHEHRVIGKQNMFFVEDNSDRRTMHGGKKQNALAQHACRH